MAPIVASRGTLFGYTAVTIKHLPSLGHELSFGTSHAKIRCDDCMFFYV